MQTYKQVRKTSVDTSVDRQKAMVQVQQGKCCHRTQNSDEARSLALCC